MTSSIFITSTGTEIGKTVFSRAVLECWNNHGIKTGYFKPVASGCEDSDWGYRSPDEVEMLQKETVPEARVEAGVRFEAPLSPDQAARREGRVCSLEQPLRTWNKIRSQADRWVVEGIGGVAVPFNRGEDVKDLIEALELPVLLVVDSILGTISHTRTAVSYLDDVVRAPSGIVVTPDTGKEIQKLNRDHLQSLYPDVPVALLPNWDDDRLTGELDRVLTNFLRKCDLL